MKKIKFFVAVLAVIILSSFLNVSAAGGALKVGEKQQNRLLLGQYHSYSFSCEETQYYEFEFENQSIETRINVGFADELLNFFVGKMTVSIYDENEKLLAAKDVRCGYTGKISLKLNEATKYRIYVDSTIVGNYSVLVTKLGDVGGDSWENANEIALTEKICATIDVANDQDWFCFETDSEYSYFEVELESLNGWSKKIEFYEYVPSAGKIPLKTLKSTSASLNEKINFNVRLDKHKKYYIMLTSSEEGGYILNLNRKIDSLSNEMEEAYSLTLNKSYVSSFDGTNDADWVKIKTSSDEAYYDVSIERLGDKAYTTIEICDSQGNQIKETRIYCGQFSVNVKLDSSSVYFICFKSEKVGNYQFTIETLIDELTDDMEEAQFVNNNQIYNSSFNSNNDADWVKIKTSSDEAYYDVSIERLGDEAYTTIEICDSQGNQIKETRIYCGQFSVNVKLDSSSVYFICFKSEKVGDYEYIIEQKNDMISDAKEYATKIWIGQKYQGSIESDNDVDWYQVELSGNIDLEIVALNESCPSLSAELYTARDMKLLTMNMYSSGEYKNHKLCNDVGTYYIKVSGREGNYTFNLNEYGKEETAIENSSNTQGGRILFTIGQKDVNVFGKIEKNDVAPIIRNSRTMLPARFVAEKLGASVYWYENEEKVVVKNNNVEIVIYINSSAAFVNGKKIILDSPAFIENGRTYTPVRFVAENLGATVDWLPDTQQVLIVK